MQQIHPGNTAWQETNPAAKHAQTGKGRKHMKVYKKIMNGRGICREIDSCAVHDPDCCAYGRKCPVP